MPRILAWSITQTLTFLKLFKLSAFFTWLLNMYFYKNSFKSIAFSWNNCFFLILLTFFLSKIHYCDLQFPSLAEYFYVSQFAFSGIFSGQSETHFHIFTNTLYNLSSIWHLTEPCCPCSPKSETENYFHEDTG